MTFHTFLRALGYTPRDYAYRSDVRCWAIAEHATIGIVAGAILEFERDARIDPETRAMAIRAVRGAREDNMGRDVVTYFPTERLPYAGNPAADGAAAARNDDASRATP